jgi:hypothetical protein
MFDEPFAYKQINATVEFAARYKFDPVTWRKFDDETAEAYKQKNMTAVMVACGRYKKSCLKTTNKK